MKESSAEDCALEYLQKHGNIHEILHCMEEDSTLPPVLVFEIVDRLLLKITSCKLDCKEQSYESCRYLLKNFITVINKMLGLTSSTKERIVILNLLTTMTTFSSSLSKDILMHANFNLTNLELLTKNTLDNKTVRKHYILFLTALLIDIEYPTLALLLDKKGMLTSIIPGLQYDDTDTVCFILTAMKNNILENQYVSKTVKMKTFNTIVVKNIVNLYNWKGPTSLKSSKKEVNISMQVDEIQKAKVSECVHDFLLVLCTSHKYGVIFRDPLVGLGKKTQNALVYTVLESMDSPWAHSYASELVIKICSSCPDLTKYVWNNLKESLQPRNSAKWFTLVSFVKKLIVELQPNVLEPYIKSLNFHQFSQLLTILIAPLPVLKVVILENDTYDFQIVRYNVMLLILTILKSLQCFLVAYKKWSDEEQFIKLKLHLLNYIEKNFPMGHVLLKNWEKQDELEQATGFNSINYLIVVFDIFEYYMDLCPVHLESLRFSHSDLKTLLETMNSFSVDMDHEKDVLQVKIIDLFLDANPTLFSLHSESFNFFLSFLIRTSYENVQNNNCNSIPVLKKFLKNTRVFDYGTEREISVWVNGIFTLKSLNENISVFLVEAMKSTHSQLLKFMTKMTEVYQHVEEQYKESEYNSCVFKPLHLSPMIMGMLEYLKIIHPEKCVVSYLYFVIPNLAFLQGDSTIFKKFFDDSSVSNSLLKQYLQLLLSEEPMIETPEILKIPKKLKIFDDFNWSLSHNNIQHFLDEKISNFSMYPDMRFDLVQMGIFNLSKLLNVGDSKQTDYSNNLIVYIKFLLNETCFPANIILEFHPFVKHFSILDVNEKGQYNCCTIFILNFIEHYLIKNKLSRRDVFIFSMKVKNMIFTILESPKKYKDLQVIDILSKFEMSDEDYFSILSRVCGYISDKPRKCNYIIFYDILVFILEQYLKAAVPETSSVKFSEEMCENLFNYYIFLNETTEINTAKLVDAFLSFILSFPKFINKVNEKLLNSILSKKEYNKAHANFIVHILKIRTDLIHCIGEKLDDIIAVKGILYSILQMFSENFMNFSDDDKILVTHIFEQVFIKCKESIHKMLRKPQKASQHIENNYKGMIFLIESNFQCDIFQEYVSRVQKFEVTKVFHTNILYTIFKKFCESKLDSKIASNMVVTFVHLLLNILKKVHTIDENTNENINKVTDCFIALLNDIKRNNENVDSNMFKNDSFKILIKLALKYGVSENEKLLQILNDFVILIGTNFEEEHVKLIVQLLITHSEFLNVILSENHKCKLGIMSLMMVMCTRWPNIMERSHVPLLLSAYQGTLTDTDKIILALLKMYESLRHQTSFDEFKPYLWGNSGANHYSVRSDIEKALFRQPKMGDVLNILREDIVLSTIKNYNLYHSKNCLETLKQHEIYDLEFFLPLFDHLLAPENVVQTYHFTRSGALSMSIIGLSSKNQKIRATACHVLSRFYSHVEARQTGKDNLLWIRLIQVIGEGVSVTDDMIFNNFASIFLARTALILTQTSHVMYVPLSQYLAAKPVLNFSSIPELYTFLHSSDVNYKDHRNFIFEILSDGLICENDYKIFFHSMALKLFTELYSSCTCDMGAKLLILDILLSVCRLPIGVKFICSHSAIIEYLVMDIAEIMKDSSSNKYVSLICKLIQIFHRLFSHVDNDFAWGKLLLSIVQEKILNSDMVYSLPNSIRQLLKQIGNS
ncbi:hypothetical protein WA026_016044 [Henosepilachna vigintioctopunctata]